MEPRLSFVTLAVADLERPASTHQATASELQSEHPTNAPCDPPPPRARENEEVRVRWMLLDYPYPGLANGLHAQLTSVASEREFEEGMESFGLAPRQGVKTPPARHVERLNVEDPAVRDPVPFAGQLPPVLPLGVCWGDTPGIADEELGGAVQLHPLVQRPPTQRPLVIAKPGVEMIPRHGEPQPAMSCNGPIECPLRNAARDEACPYPRCHHRPQLMFIHRTHDTWI